MFQTFRRFIPVVLVVVLLLVPASSLMADQEKPRLSNVAERVLAWIDWGFGEIAVVFAEDALYPEMDPNGVATSSPPSADSPEDLEGDTKDEASRAAVPNE